MVTYFCWRFCVAFSGFDFWDYFFLLLLIEICSLNVIKVFKNYGATAGASLSHSHSQIIGLPIVPPMVSTRLDSMKEYFDRTGKCGLCDIQFKKILIDESSHFYAIVPFAASYPFEIWIVPRKHASHFHEIDGERVTSLFYVFFGLFNFLCSQGNLF